MKKLFILFFALFSLFAYSACSNVDDSDVSDDLGNASNIVSDDLGSSIPVDVELGNQQVFVLSAEDFSFSMDGEKAPELKVKLGDTVRVELSVVSGFHDFVIDEFNASTARVNEGESVFVEFIADKAGTFEYYCSVGEHRAAGMFGKLIVE
jgi:plastocyanin